MAAPVKVISNQPQKLSGEEEYVLNLDPTEIAGKIDVYNNVKSAHKYDAILILARIVYRSNCVCFEVRIKVDRQQKVELTRNETDLRLVNERELQKRLFSMCFEFVSAE